MRLRPLSLALAAMTACGGPDKGDTAPSTDTDTDADTDADADADTDADTDADADTDTTPPAPESNIRVLHVAPGHGPVDVFVNQGAQPILDGLTQYAGTAWSERPVGTFDFQFTADGGNPAAPLVSLPAVPLGEDEHHTFIVHTAVDGALAVLRVIDDPNGIQPTDQRIRWTHVAPDLATFDLVEVSTGTKFVDDLAPGATYVSDYPAGPMTMGLDYEGDGVMEHVFEGFNLAQSAGPGKMVDIQIVSELGVPFLIAYQPTGTVARRDAVPPATGTDTASDTGP